MRKIQNGGGVALTTQDSAIASISDKVQANVDDAGNVTFEKGIIKNNDNVLKIGIRKVQSDTKVDLSDATLQIKCGDVELYNKNLGTTQVNDEYVTVPVGVTTDLTYTIKIPAEKAKQLVGTQPITLTTTVDLVVSKGGEFTNTLGSAIEGATVTYSYIDPYDSTKTITATTKTDKDGNYTISNIKKGENVTVQISYEKDGHKYVGEKQDIKFEDEKTKVDPIVAKTDPVLSDLVFNAPSNLVYDGNAKVATFSKGTSCPEGMENSVTVKYSTDGKTWVADAPKDTGIYYVCADIDGDGKDWNSVQLTDSENWKFTITKASATITLDKYSGEVSPSGGTIEFSVASISPEPETETFKYSAVSGDESIATVEAIASAEGKKATFTVTGKKVGTTTINVSAESKNYIATEVRYSITVKTTEYYSGKVLTPNSTGTAYDGVVGADVTFTPKSGDTATTVKTVEGGIFKLTGIAQRTPGDISISYSSEPDTYSDDPKECTTDTTTLDDFHIGKLQDLSVEIYGSFMSTGKDHYWYYTWWLPAFVDESINVGDIKFYTYDNKSFISPTNETRDKYKMQDLGPSNGSHLGYFAICTIGQKLLCYQVAQACENNSDHSLPYEKVFDLDQAGKTTGIKEDIISKRCKDANAQTVYYNGNEKQTSDNWDHHDETIPKLNGVYVCGGDGGASDKSTWFGAYYNSSINLIDDYPSILTSCGCNVKEGSWYLNYDFFHWRQKEFKTVWDQEQAGQQQFVFVLNRTFEGC